MAKIGNTLNVICLDSEAFYALIDDVVDHIKKEHAPEKERWMSDSEAMELLKISSKTTLQKYRDEGRIRYSQPSRKIILYDRVSLLEFLDENAKDTF